jgi:hypothetical protein
MDDLDGRRMDDVDGRRMDDFEVRRMDGLDGRHMDDGGMGPLYPSLMSVPVSRA